MMKTFEGRLLLTAFAALLCCAGALKPKTGPGDADLCATVRCPSTQNPCQAATCDPDTGDCVVSNRANGRQCDDGNKCTTGDVCDDGTCVGVPRLCLPSGNCTTNKCNVLTGLCDLSAVPNGKACDDGKACTTGDTCNNGVCKGTPVVCVAQDACKPAQCVEPTGCVATAKPDGTPCPDKDKCTINSKCNQGVCGNGLPKVCSSADQCVSKKCNLATGACDPVLLDGRSCTDGKKCTSGDVCKGGICKGTPKVCLAPAGSQCIRTRCSELTGACAVIKAANGTPCNDGNKCTTNDRCSRGVCVGIPKVCLGSQCVRKRCNPATGTCDATIAPNKTPCNDGRLCTLKDACTDGVCKGTPVTCPASGKQCAGLACNEKSGKCDVPVPFAAGTRCDDGNKCTTNDSCNASGDCKGVPKCPKP